jgi:hypothetical protein
MRFGKFPGQLVLFPKEFALETSTVVATSFSSTRILPPDSRSSRATHGSTVQTASTYFCWKSWS